MRTHLMACQARSTQSPSSAVARAGTAEELEWGGAVDAVAIGRTDPNTWALRIPPCKPPDNPASMQRQGGLSMAVSKDVVDLGSHLRPPERL